MNDRSETGSTPGQATPAPRTVQGAPAQAGAAGQPPARLKRVSDGAAAPLLPDCCNVGVAVRVAVAVNLAALAHVLLRTATPGEALAGFIRVASWLEAAILLSLAALCVGRRRVAGRARALQWGVGLGVPVLATLITSLAAQRLGVTTPDPGSAAWPLGLRAVAAAAAAAALIEYFGLRARAFSPSLSEARLQALQARIRPHFLFNSLNTVLSLMRSRPREAEATLENLADLFRVFMKDTRELVPLDDEIETCRQYLAIEQLRLGERLRVEWSIEAMPGDALLPSLLLQPLVENAVHHGIEPRTESGTIAIEVVRVGERVRVEIVNPIAEQAPTRPGNQMALSNVRERLMLLYDMEAELKTAPDAGRFRLTLEFPYRKERRRRDVRRHHSPDR